VQPFLFIVGIRSVDLDTPLDFFHSFGYEDLEIQIFYFVVLLVKQDFTSSVCVVDDSSSVGFLENLNVLLTFLVAVPKFVVVNYPLLFFLQVSHQAVAIHYLRKR
jgi:hypothetical protein